MTISEAARLTGVSRTTLHKIENGVAISPTKLAEIVEAMLRHPRFQKARAILYAQQSRSVTGNTPMTAGLLIAVLDSIEQELAYLVSLAQEETYMENGEPVFTRDQVTVLAKLLRDMGSHVARLD